jgi:hypothetical protein
MTQLEEIHARYGFEFFRKTIHDTCLTATYFIGEKNWRYRKILTVNKIRAKFSLCFIMNNLNVLDNKLLFLS